MVMEYDHLQRVGYCGCEVLKAGLLIAMERDRYTLKTYYGVVTLTHPDIRKKTVDSVLTYSPEISE